MPNAPAPCLRAALLALLAVALPLPAHAQPSEDVPDTRSDASRAHQACLRDAWQGSGGPCFRRWLAAFEEEASPAELARAARELAREDQEARLLEAAAFLTVRDTSSRDVWVDDEPVGRAPIERLPLTPGAHSVSLRPSAGGATMREVTLFVGEEDLVEFKGAPASGESPGTTEGTSAGPGPSPSGVRPATGAVFDFCAPKGALSKSRVLILAPAGADDLHKTSDLDRVGASELARQVFAARFPLVRFDNVAPLEAGDIGWLDEATLSVADVRAHLDRAAEKSADLGAREGRFASYSAGCADDLVVPAITEHELEWVVTTVKGKDGKTTTIRTPQLEMSAAIAIFRRNGGRYERVAKLEASAPSLADVLSDLAIASMPTAGIGGMSTLDLVATAAAGPAHLSAIPDAACLAANAPMEGSDALLRCAKQGASRVELAVHAVDERLGPECTAAREGGGDAALVTCEVRARTFQLTRSLKKQARGVDGWRLSAPLGVSRGDDVIALGEKEGLEVGYGFVAVNGDGERVGYYKVTDVGEGALPSRVSARAGSAAEGTMLQEYPQMGLTIGTLGFAQGVALNDPPTRVGNALVGTAPFVAGGLLQVGYDLSGALGAVETHLRLDMGFGGGVGVGANTLVVPTAVWIEKGFYLADRLTLFGALGGGFQVVILQLVETPSVDEQTLQAYGGGPAARAGFALQLHPDVELRFEGIGSGSVVPADYQPTDDGDSLPAGFGAREDRWFLLGGRAGLGILL